MLDVTNCSMAVLTVYCVWLALADHTASTTGKYTSAVMYKRWRAARWRAARWLARWHGGEPRQYIGAAVLGYSVLCTPSARWCWILLAVDLQLGFYMLRTVL